MTVTNQWENGFAQSNGPAPGEGRRKLKPAQALIIWIVASVLGWAAVTLLFMWLG